MFGYKNQASRVTIYRRDVFVGRREEEEEKQLPNTQPAMNKSM
jgi:hypothetical protein